jgi:hypothetical protein
LEQAESRLDIEAVQHAIMDRLRKDDNILQGIPLTGNTGHVREISEL